MKRKLFSWKMVQLFFIGCILTLTNLGLSAQNIPIQGKIVDASGMEPMIGVSVLQKGTTNGTITDFDGNFSLNVPADAIIVLSYIGYTTIELPCNRVTGIIQMKEDAQSLDELVVVGYGVQKKVNLTGAVSAIDGDAIAAKPASDALTALQGEMPGVTVIRTSGQPGDESSSLRIRGFSSTNDAKALVLIDGVEGDLALINPSDIENISVLKDAAASAIYGSRAAAGVVLVTTKSGSSGKTRVTYNGYFAVNTPSMMPERLPAWEEQEFINLSRINQGGNPEWNPEQSSWIGNPNFNYRPNNTNDRWDFFQSTDWVREGTKKATTQLNHSVSVSGGSEKLNYFLSASYFSKNGILKYGPDSNERYNIRAKINAEINQYVSLGVNVSYQGQFTEKNSTAPTTLLERLYRVRGRQPIYNPEEDINESPYNGDLQINAIDLMKNGGQTDSRYEAYIGKGTLTLKNFVKGLRIDLSASRHAGYWAEDITKRNLVWYDRLGKGIRFQSNNPNEFQKTKNSDIRDLLEALVNYNIDVDKHSFAVLAGMSYENSRKDQMRAKAKNMLSNDFFSLNYYDSSNASNTEISDEIRPWAMQSYFGRFNYNYDNRYLFEANVRYDGSSRLAPDSRWRAFPSFSLAWRISEEQWFDIPVISNFKARGSWGQLGNGAVLGVYDYLPLINAGYFMGDGYYYQKQLASFDKTWEVIETTNIGIDLGMFNNRLNLTADYYWKYNKDMLASVELPKVVGVEVPQANVGRLKTWGWEIDLSWKDKIGQVGYNIGLNLSDSDNKLQQYSGINTVKEGMIPLLEGYPINTIWGYKTDGYWSSREEYLAYKEANPGYESFQDGLISGGDVKYVAQGKPDHRIGAGEGTPENSGDLVYLGNSNARYTYGINLGLQWRNFDFSMMFQGVAKRNVMVHNHAIAPLAQTSYMPWTIHRDYWTEDNQDAKWPRLYNYNNGDIFNFRPSDKWIQNAAYIRLKNITVGYNVPLKKTKMIESLRVYVAGADIWEHTKMLSVFDPEAGEKKGSNGNLEAVNATYYPFFRSWTVGLSVSF